MANTKIYKMAFASVYPHYITKAEKKGRTKVEVDTIFSGLQDMMQTAFNNIWIIRPISRAFLHKHLK